MASTATDATDTKVVTFEEIIVERGGQLFALRPKQRHGRKQRGLSPSDPLLDIIGLGGIIDANGPTDVSTNKHKYLADAAADLHTGNSGAHGDRASALGGQKDLDSIAATAE